MSFALFEFSEIEESAAGSFIRRFPDFIKKRLIKRRIKKLLPYKSESIRTADSDGFRITLPFTRDEALSDMLLFYSTTEAIMEKLAKEGVSVCVSPYGIPLPQSAMPVADGRTLCALLSIQIIKKALRMLDKPLEQAEVLVIDGCNELTDIALESVYPNVNFLSVYTPNVQRLDNLRASVLYDYGLDIQAFSNCKNNMLKYADVIINCGMDMENYDYYFKKGSAYIDISRNTPKLKRIMSKRRDMLFVDGIGVRLGEERAPAEIMEAALYDRGGEFADAMEGRAAEAPQSIAGMKAEELYALGARVSHRDLEKLLQRIKK